MAVSVNVTDVWCVTSCVLVYINVTEEPAVSVLGEKWWKMDVEGYCETLAYIFETTLCQNQRDGLLQQLCPRI